MYTDGTSPGVSLLSTANAVSRGSHEPVIMCDTLSLRSSTGLVDASVELLDLVVAILTCSISCISTCLTLRPGLTSIPKHRSTPSLQLLLWEFTWCTLTTTFFSTLLRNLKIPFCLGTTSNCRVSAVAFPAWAFFSFTALLAGFVFSFISSETSKINASSVSSLVSSEKVITKITGS